MLQTVSYVDENHSRMTNHVKRKQLLTRDLSDLVSICVTSELSAAPFNKHPLPFKYVADDVIQNLSKVK